MWHEGIKSNCYWWSDWKDLTRNPNDHQRQGQPYPSEDHCVQSCSYEHESITSSNLFDQWRWWFHSNLTLSICHEISNSTRFAIEILTKRYKNENMYHYHQSSSKWMQSKKKKSSSLHIRWWSINSFSHLFYFIFEKFLPCWVDDEEICFVFDIEEEELLYESE